MLEKFSAIQMIDVHLPSTGGRKVILSRYTRPEKELPLPLLLLQLGLQLGLQLPAQPPPRIAGADVVKTSA